MTPLERDPLGAADLINGSKLFGARDFNAAPE